MGGMHGAIIITIPQGTAYVEVRDIPRKIADALAPIPEGGKPTAAWINAQNTHYWGLLDAVRRGEIAMLDAATRRATSEIKPGAIVSIADARAYLERCGIELHEADDGAPVVEVRSDDQDRHYWEMLQAAQRASTDTEASRASPQSAPDDGGGRQLHAPGSPWTDDDLKRLAQYRKTHGTKAAAQEFGISQSRVRQLLPTNKTKLPTANAPFGTKKRR